METRILWKLHPRSPDAHQMTRKRGGIILQITPPTHSLNHNLFPLLGSPPPPLDSRLFYRDHDPPSDLATRLTHLKTQLRRPKCLILDVWPWPGVCKPRMAPKPPISIRHGPPLPRQRRHGRCRPWPPWTLPPWTTAHMNLSVRVDGGWPSRASCRCHVCLCW